MVPYFVRAVVAVTVMHVLLFVFSANAYIGGTRGSSVLGSACDVLEMSVVRGVGGVCHMCMCLARGGVGGVG